MGKKIENLTGKTFNRLVVLKENGRAKSGDVLWECQCQCENKTIINVTGSNLTSGHTQSCGCYMKERIIKSHKKYNTYDLSGEYGVGYTNKDEPFYFDLEDFDKIKNHCWYIDANGYICCHLPNKQYLYMHRYILNVIDDVVDHKDGYTFNNRKYNLRDCTYSNNQMNRKKQNNNTSGTTGVSYSDKQNSWRAYITIDGNQINLGYFSTINQAIEARKDAENKYFKNFSYTNSRGIL